MMGNLKSFLIFVAIIALAGGGLFFLKNGLGDKTSSLPQNVTVGNVKGSSVDISWITSGKTASRIMYGETPVLGKTAEVPGLGLAHLVTIDSLKPSTTYYFQVGSDKNSTKPFTFRTLAEVKDTPQIAVISPFGKLLSNETSTKPSTEPRVLAEATESGIPTDPETTPTGTPETGSLEITLLTAFVLSLFVVLGFKLLKN